jgi:hypothetical protein
MGGDSYMGLLVNECLIGFVQEIARWNQRFDRRRRERVNGETPFAFNSVTLTLEMYSMTMYRHDISNPVIIPVETYIHMHSITTNSAL